MRFCETCDNMLYPSENKEKEQLQFECKICKQYYQSGEPSKDNNLVYRNEVKLAQKNIIIDPGIIDDPTYSRIKGKVKCPKCGFDEVIYFQSPNINDPGMRFIFMCCNKTNDKKCGYWWYKQSEDAQAEEFNL